MVDQPNHANNSPAPAQRPNQDTYLFSLLGTPVTAEPSALLTLIAAFGLGLALAGLRYDRPSFLTRLRFGLVGVVAYYMGDLFHLFGHVFSARYAGAPMDRIHLGAALPLTLYENNHVAPQTHCLRAIGGPIGSGLGFLITRLLSRLAPAGSIWRDFFNLMALSNEVTGLGSFYPLPFIDGGTLLKWTLIQQGATPDEADRLVQQTNLALGAASVVGFLLAGRRIIKATITFLKNGLSA